MTILEMNHHNGITRLKSSTALQQPSQQQQQQTVTTLDNYGIFWDEYRSIEQSNPTPSQQLQQQQQHDDAEDGSAQAKEDKNETEIQWLNDVGFTNIAKKIRARTEIDRNDDDMKIIAASLTRAQANAVRKRIDSLNDAIRQRKAEDEKEMDRTRSRSKRKDVRNLFENAKSSTKDGSKAASTQKLKQDSSKHKDGQSKQTKPEMNDEKKENIAGPRFVHIPRQDIISTSPRSGTTDISTKPSGVTRAVSDAQIPRNKTQDIRKSWNAHEFKQNRTSLDADRPSSQQQQQLSPTLRRVQNQSPQIDNLVRRTSGSHLIFMTGEEREKTLQTKTTQPQQPSVTRRNTDSSLRPGSGSLEQFRTSYAEEKQHQRTNSSDGLVNTYRVQGGAVVENKQYISGGEKRLVIVDSKYINVNSVSDTYQSHPQGKDLKRSATYSNADIYNNTRHIKMTINENEKFKQQQHNDKPTPNYSNKPVKTIKVYENSSNLSRDTRTQSPNYENDDDFNLSLQKSSSSSLSSLELSKSSPRTASTQQQSRDTKTRNTQPHEPSPYQSSHTNVLDSVINNLSSQVSNVELHETTRDKEISDSTTTERLDNKKDRSDSKRDHSDSRKDRSDSRKDRSASNCSEHKPTDTNSQNNTSSRRVNSEKQKQNGGHSSETPTAMPEIKLSKTRSSPLPQTKHHHSSPQHHINNDDNKSVSSYSSMGGSSDELQQLSPTSSTEDKNFATIYEQNDNKDEKSPRHHHHHHNVKNTTSVESITTPQSNTPRGESPGLGLDGDAKLNVGSLGSPRDTTNSKELVTGPTFAPLPNFTLTREELGMTHVGDLSTNDMTKVCSLALLELTALFDAYSIPMNRRKTPTKLKYKDSGMFGVPLHAICQREQNKKDPQPKAPRLFREMLRFLENYGLQEEGILRIPGAAGRVKSFREECDKSKVADVSFEGKKVSDIATCLKQFLRDLPIPLLSHEYQNTFSSVANLPNRKVQLQALNLLVLLLNPYHQETLRCLLVFLNKIISFEAKNKMGLNNVAMIIAPNLFFQNNAKIDIHEASKAAGMTDVLRMLIKYQQILWTIPSFMVGQIRYLYEAGAKTKDPKAVRKIIAKRVKTEGPITSNKPSRHKSSGSSGDELEEFVEEKIIRIKAPSLNKQSMAMALTDITTAADVVSRFQWKRQNSQKEKDEIDTSRLSINNKSKKKDSNMELVLCEIGGNIGERRLDPSTNLMAVLRVNPNAEWVLKGRIKR